MVVASSDNYAVPSVLTVFVVSSCTFSIGFTQHDYLKEVFVHHLAEAAVLLPETSGSVSSGRR